MYATSFMFFLVSSIYSFLLNSFFECAFSILHVNANFAHIFNQYHYDYILGLRNMVWDSDISGAGTGNYDIGFPLPH